MAKKTNPMTATIQPNETSFISPLKEKRKTLWNPHIHLKLLDKLPFNKIIIFRIKPRKIPDPITIVEQRIPEDEKDGEDPKKEASIATTTQEDNTQLIEPHLPLNDRKKIIKYKTKIMIASIFLYVIQGFVAACFGYNFSTQCMLTPVLPWLVFTHGIISLATFLIIVFILKNDFSIRHGEVRILSAIYAVIVVAGIVITIFNDNRIQTNEDASLFCRNEISIMLKMNTPWAIGQICLLQVLLL